MNICQKLTASLPTISKSPWRIQVRTHICIRMVQFAYFFLKTHGLTPYFKHFLTLITMSSLKCTFSIKKIPPPPHLWPNNKHGGGGVKKSKCENNIKWGSKRCEMMRGFQNWPQSSNQVTFDLVSGKNCRKWAKLM